MWGIFSLKKSQCGVEEAGMIPPFGKVEPTLALEGPTRCPSTHHENQGQVSGAKGWGSGRRPINKCVLGPHTMRRLPPLLRGVPVSGLGGGGCRGKNSPEAAGASGRAGPGPGLPTRTCDGFGAPRAHPPRKHQHRSWGQCHRVSWVGSVSFLP